MATKLSLIIVTLLTITQMHQTTAYITLTNLGTILSLSYSLYSPTSKLHTLFSLSHSLVSRVSILRDSRGDHEGAARAQVIAKKLELGLGLRPWNVFWGFVLDYGRNYKVVVRNVAVVAADVNELMSSVAEFARLRNESERVEWVEGFYRRVVRVFISLFNRLLSVFTESVPLRELVEALVKEMEEGDFVKDCLEVGSKDLKGMYQISKDLASQYTNSDLKQLSPFCKL